MCLPSLVWEISKPNVIFSVLPISQKVRNGLINVLCPSFFSPKAPMYDLIGHKKRVEAVDWSHSKYIISGSQDCTVKAYTAKN